MAKVSIIIPVYNTSTNLLKQCLKSADGQTFKDIEIIAVNDGSTDNSYEALREYQNIYKNLIIYTKDNGGASSARSLALKHATGKYAFFLDSDDYINKDVIDRMVNQADDNNVKLVKLRIFYEYENGSIFKDFKVKREFDFNRDKSLIAKSSTFGCDKLYHYSLFEDLMTSQRVNEDLTVQPYLFIKAGKMLVDNDAIYHYFRHKDSTIAKTLETLSTDNLINTIEPLTELRNKLINCNLYDTYKDEFYAIAIKHFHQRISSLVNSKILNDKKELLILIYQLMDCFIPNWRNNKYYKSGFMGFQLGEQLAFLLTLIQSRLITSNKVTKTEETKDNIITNYDHILKKRS